MQLLAWARSLGYVQRAGVEGTGTYGAGLALALFRSFKTEWLPSTGYMTAQEAQRDISHYLMHRYNWIRPHQFNEGLAPAVTEEKLNVVSGMG